MKQSISILVIFLVTSCTTKIVGIDQYALLDVEDIRNSNGTHYEFVVTESLVPTDIGLKVLLCGIASNGELVTQLAEGRKECLWDYMLDVKDRYVTGYLVNSATLTPTTKWWRDGTIMTLQKVKKGLHPISKYQDNAFKLAVSSDSQNQLYKEYKELVEPVLVERSL
ncbi:MAG: hypothetical protein VW666_06425 [Methylophilaceae bacterium]